MTLAITIGLTLCIIGALAYGYLLYTPVITAPALKKSDRLLCARFTNRIGCKQLAAVGVQHAIFNMPLDYTTAPLETIGCVVIPAIREL